MESDAKVNFERPFWVALTAILLVIILFLAVRLSPLHANRQAVHKMDFVYNQIMNNALQPVDSNELATVAIKAMLESLNDPYSVYLDNQANRFFVDLATGSFGGLGLTLLANTNQQGLIISTVISTGPAFKAGLKPGDSIIAINGEDSHFLTVDEAVTQIRGPVHSEITLAIERDNEIFDVTLKREKIELDTVQGTRLTDNIGLIKIEQFSSSTPNQFRKAFTLLQSEGELKALIIDLRYNSGGLYTSAVAIANDFLDEGIIVSQKGRNPAYNKEEMADKKIIVPKDLPVVILINHYTASASEILAASLADNGRATLIGTTTYGKGLIQQQFNFKSDNTEGFKLTTSHYLTPKGNDINHKGITPLITVEENYPIVGDERTDLVLEKALLFIKREL